MFGTYSSLAGNLVVGGRGVLQPSAGACGSLIRTTLNEALHALASRASAAVGRRTSSSSGRSNTRARAKGVLVTLDECLGTSVKLANGGCLLALEKAAVLLFKLINGLHRHGRGAVADSGSVVSFVDGNGRVNNLRSDGVLLDNRLDVLVKVVVDVLALNNGSLGSGVNGVVGYRCVAVTSDICVLHGLGVIELVMLKGLVLNRCSIVNVLLRTRRKALALLRVL